VIDDTTVLSDKWRLVWELISHGAQGGTWQADLAVI
jgi:hypothetical protein